MTWRSMVAPLMALLVAMPVLADQASAQRVGHREQDWRDREQRGGDWEALGSTRIGRYGVDRDEIDIGRRKGRFTAIGIEARKGSVYVLRARVVFGNNDVQRISVRQWLREGERTRPVDLKGGARAIKRIEIEARSGRSGRRATVTVLGERIVDEPWQRLGSTRIGRYGWDRDEIDIGRRKGRFQAIGIEARRGTAYVRRVRIVFGNNEVQRVDVRKWLREGERTRPIDLRNSPRRIKRVEIEARSRPGSRRRAVIDLFGKKVDIDDRWELLGEERANRRLDSDTIRVGRRKGRFDRIALEVHDNDVEIRDLRVFFRSGRPQDVRVPERMRAGDRTRAIKLRGGERIIERIEIRHRTRGRGELATVAVYGLKADRRRPVPPRDRWRELGCQKVGFGRDKDTIRLGRREGRFEAIRLRVERSDVLLMGVRVVYERGRPQEFDVGYRVRAGRLAGPFDWGGESRAIKQIDLVYSSLPGLRGSARLCVEGFQEGRGRRR